MQAASDYEAPEALDWQGRALDAAWQVRRLVALRADASLAERLLEDEEIEVVAAARERLQELSRAQTERCYG